MRIGSIKNGDRYPTGWLQMMSPVKACRGTSDKTGCYPTYFNNTNLPYQHICGKVVGYQKRTSDAFYTFRYPSKSLDIPYVDGVSFRYNTPRKHLFTYANGYSYGTSHTRAKCPCVGGDNPLRSYDVITFVSQEPLVVQVTAQFTVLTLYGMEKDARLVIAAVHRLAHHGFIEMC